MIILILVLLLFAPPISAIPLCSGGDSLAHPVNTWTGKLPPGFETSALGIAGATSGLWKPPPPPIDTMTDCAGGKNVLGAMNLGTNDNTFGVPSLTYISNSVGILNHFGSQQSFGMLVWIYRHYPDMEIVCDAYQWVTCIDQDSILGPGDYADGTHPNHQGQQKIADAFMIAVPEPNKSLLIIVGIVIVVVFNTILKTNVYH